MQAILEYSLEALSCTLPNKRQVLAQYMASMNQAWQRLASGVRYNQLKDGKEEMVGNCVERLIQAQIDEGLKAHGDL